MGDTKDMKKGSDITLTFLVSSHLSSPAALASSGSAERKTLSLNLQRKFSGSKDAEPHGQFVNQFLATMHATL